MSINIIHVPQKQQQVFPAGTMPLETQVAGHIFQPGTNLIGMLKDKSDGSVLKPLGKPVCGAREIAFYESIQNPCNPDLRILKNFVPTYLGTVKMQLNNRDLEFIKLNDLTTGMIEPCIMDIKVGKRTWDPLATPEKIATEKDKYAECKQNLGLCIPGFQVNLLPKNDGPVQLKRFGKDYGKQLNVKSFLDTIRLFLNGDIGLCRQLILDILTQLRPIQMWYRKQTVITFYSSSILIVYDAKRLRSYLKNDKPKANPEALISNNGTNLHGLKSNLPSHVNNKINDYTIATNGIDNLKLNGQLNGFSDEMSLAAQENGQNKRNYSDHFGVHVKMIDFAHAFTTTDQSIDSNYLFGIEHLVKIFDQLLEESINSTK